MAATKFSFLTFPHQTAVISRASSRSPCCFLFCFLFFLGGGSEMIDCFKTTSMEKIKSDFTKCFLFQSDDKNDLRHPSKGWISTSYQPYHTLALDIIELNNLNQLPFDIDADAFQLSGLEKCLKTIKLCSTKYAETKLIVKRFPHQKYFAECSVAVLWKQEELACLLKCSMFVWKQI